jgi:hypothetical protein
VSGYIIATRFFAALSAFQVVGGINCFASRAGIVPPDFLKPLLITDRPDSFKIAPKLNPMRHRGLKLFEVIAGVFFTFAAKIDALLGRAGGHLTFFAIGQSLVRPAPVAPAFFH